MALAAGRRGCIRRHQTRPHRDVDVDFYSTYEHRVLAVLADIGYSIETDWRPNRAELFALGKGRVDPHPLVIAAKADAKHKRPLDGGGRIPDSRFTSSSLGGKRSHGISLQVQHIFRPAR